MTLRQIHIIRNCFIGIIALTLYSCATYNKQVAAYYSSLQQGNYERAAKSLDNNKLLKKQRNQLLFLLERGKVAHLLNQWDSSNTYFNQADLLMEDARTSVKDVALGTLLNPMMKTYQAEDFEKYLVHYYKAINYLQLGQPQEALVEARRITLRTNTQEDKTGNRNKYSEDAFSLMIQGLIYEKNGDINNAFISYRNAADVYLAHNGSYYGTPMPLQLKQDLLRLADLNGFSDELNRYEKLLNTTYTRSDKEQGGELILFWENGSAPVKAQQDLFFSLFKDAGGNFFFSDGSGYYNNIPWASGYSNSNVKLEDLRSFRVALPKYEAIPPVYSEARLTLNSISRTLEPAENVNTLAFSTLKERMLRELSSTLTRLAVKKLAEAAVRPKENKSDDKNKSEEEKKKERKKENTKEAVALGLQLFNFASEKADTRNWQSLPHTIYYTRMPLQQGANSITLQLNGRSTQTLKLEVAGNGTMQFRNVCTIR